MELNKKYARTSQTQLKCYIAFIKQHPEFLAGKNTPCAPKTMDSLWNDLASQLNSCVGPTKSANVWKDTLRNWRKQLMFRARKYKAEQQRTGGGQNAVAELSEFEQQAVAAFGAVAVNGHNVPFLGSGQVSVDDVVEVVLQELTHRSPSPPPTVTSSPFPIPQSPIIIPSTISSPYASSTPIITQIPTTISPPYVFSPITPSPPLPASPLLPSPPAIPTNARSSTRRRRPRRNARDAIMEMVTKDIAARKEENQRIVDSLSTLTAAVQELVNIQRELLNRSRP